MSALTADELLAGSSLTHEVEIPADLLAQNGHGPTDPRVVIRPLAVRDLQRIGKAAADNENLSAALMIQQALVEPELKVDEVSRLVRIEPDPA